MLFINKLASFGQNLYFEVFWKFLDAKLILLVSICNVYFSLGLSEWWFNLNFKISKIHSTWPLKEESTWPLKEKLFTVFDFPRVTEQK